MSKGLQSGTINQSLQITSVHAFVVKSLYDRTVQGEKIDVKEITYNK